MMTEYYKNTYKYYKQLLNTNTPGTYTVQIDKTTDYTFTLVGGGGGGGGDAVSANGWNGGGGSAACFKGIIHLTQGTYTVIVGSGGAGTYVYNTSTRSGVDGTLSSITDSSSQTLIQCNPGTHGTASSSNMYPGSGGTLIINDNSIIISTEIASDGQAGGKGNMYAGWPVVDGGYSTYDGTHTGYGAGGCSGDLPNGVNGYCLLERESDETDWTRRVIIHTDWRHFYTSTNLLYCHCSERTIRTYYKDIITQTTPGTYEITVPDGDYIVELVGAGGGAAKARATTDRWYMASACGGSGAYFKGIVHLNTGTYTINIGQGGTTSVSGWNGTATATDGGDSSIVGIITAGGGTGAIYNLYSSPRNVGYGGVLTYDNLQNIIQIDKGVNGLDGTSAGSGATNDSSGFPNLPRTLSVYDNTVYGYGAGAGTNNGDQINPDTVALDGYCKIYQQVSKNSDYTYYIDEIKYEVPAIY